MLKSNRGRHEAQTARRSTEVAEREVVHRSTGTGTYFPPPMMLDLYDGHFSVVPVSIWIRSIFASASQSSRTIPREPREQLTMSSEENISMSGKKEGTLSTSSIRIRRR